ncbi:hypothetical protein [Rhizobium sp. Root1220]|uniref:hypothetical protein n=1 Tax=Rhizobium sp. Root1220 TaxID=1736432 RepID=UPI0006F928F4|nr:hypothetical protein [Rhizobium sp. Root1220]KQV65116.1 hypothetical protein ASC90_14545 [Rhizobium sp. Root1220]
MVQPLEPKRFDHRKGRASRLYAALEQIQADERQLRGDDPARNAHHLTHDGDLVTRVDESHFLIMLREP